MRYVAVVLMVQRFVTAAVGIAALLAGAGVTAVAGIYLGGALLAVGLGVAVQSRAVAKPSPRVTPAIWPALMRAAVPLGIAGVFGTVLFRVDTVILAAFESTSVVGDYGAAYRLFEATLFVSWSIGGAVYPVLSRLDASEQLSDVYEQALKLSLAATLPLAVGAGVLAAPLIEILYGSDFEDAATALRLLSPSIALFAVVYVTGTVLIARRRQRFLAVAYGVVTVLNIGLNLLLIPLLSLEGAALSTTATEVLLLVATIGPARRMLGGVAWLRVVTGPGLAAAATAVVMLALEDWFWLAVAAGAGAFVLVLALVERIAFPADAQAFWAFVRRREVPASRVAGAGPPCAPRGRRSTRHRRRSGPGRPRRRSGSAGGPPGSAPRWRSQRAALRWSRNARVSSSANQRRTSSRNDEGMRTSPPVRRS